MRIVRLADLSEEERKRVLEEQQNRVKQNRQESQELQRQANEKFNDVIRRDGEFHTSGTTNIGTIRKAYRNSSNYNTVNNSLNSYYNQNKTSLWDKIIDRSNFIAKKTGTGVMSGMVGIGQALITDTANNMEKGKKENTNQLINNLINSFSSQSPMDYIMRNLPQYAKKQFETLTDKNKNGIEKATSFVNNAVSEVTDSYNNKLSSLSQVLGKINPNTSEKLLEANEKISEPIDKINEKLGEESKKYGTTANVIADVGQSIGNMAPSILASIATKNPNIGLATMGLSAKGQSTEEALKKGADLDIAVKTGNTKGMIEIGTEMLTGGVNIFGKGALDDLLQKGIVDKVKNNVAKFAVKQGVNVAGETLEETISDILGTTIDKGTVDPNAKYTLKDWKDTAVTTTLTTLVLNSLGMAGNIKNISNEDKANKNVQNLLNEKNQNAQNNQQNFQIQQIVQEQNKTVQNIKGFHGTDANFENYNLDYFGKHDEGDFGKAIYFSTNKRMASKYGKNIKENSINLNNPLVINSEQDYQNMWHKLAQEVDKSKLTNEEVTLINDKYTSQVDKDYLLYNTLTAEEKSNALQKLGYDGIIDNTYNQIAVFDSNNIENNSKIEYNNNESVGGLNEQLQRRGFLEGNAEQTRIYKDSQPQQKEYTRAEYEKWEKSVEPIKEADITTEQRTIKNNIKGQYNKDIVFFDGNNSDNSYSGGVSYDNPNKINIDTKQAETFGLNKMIYHEVLESDILNNTELYKDMIKPSIQKIMNDPSFEKQKSIFWEGQKDNVPSDYLIAKDILCDRFSEMKTGEKWDYDNVLSQETNMTIDYAIENFHKSLYGKNVNVKVPLVREKIENNYVANNQEILYNNTESVGGINGQSQFTNKQETAEQSINERGMVRDVETMRRKEQGRNTADIKDAKGEIDGSRVYEDNFSKEGQSIEQAYKDKETILKTMEYAKQKPYVTPSQEIQQVRNKAKELGIPLNIYSGEEGNIHIGLTDGKEIYLDVNKKNISKEDGSLMNRFSHEVLHYIKRNTNFRDTISELQNRIVKENPESIKTMVKNKGYEFNNISKDFESAIAEEGLADYSAKHLSGYDIDYNLPEDITYVLNTTIDDAITELKLNNKNGESNTQNINKKVTRHEAIQKYRELAKENIENIATWKDKSNGLKYQLETMERNMFDIIPDKVEAQKMVDTYFEPIHKAEADKQRFINKYNERIKDYDLNKYEAEAVQVLGEYKYNPSFKTDGVDKHNQTILDRVNENIEKGRVDKEKVNEAIETFRNIYDELFEIENKTLREYGYEEKPYRKGYFPHFVEDIPTTKVDKLLDKLGFKVDRRSLPTDIAGITEQFVPGKTWNRSALERKGNKTDYNALKGFDTYIQQASDNIFHTENIQKLRGLENEIRYQYSDKGVQERIDEILKNETLFEEEKQDLMDKIFAQVDNPVPNLVTELRRYTNALANKKSEADRSTEQSAGRQFYNTVNAIENRFGANAVGLNIGSAVTNFIPITQAYSQVSTKNMGRAFLDTVKSYVKNDGFVDKSTFLTNRLNQSEKLYKTSLEKISDKTSFLFNAIDEVTSNIVVRGKYWENISKGMSEIEAIKNADRFAANVIADRSKGALPTKFEEKNPLTKMFTQFQLEVNNQYRYMFKDIPRDLKDKGVAQVALAFFKMFVGAWLYNKVSEEVTGRKSAFSPIDLAVSSYGTMMDSDKTTYQKISGVATEIGEQAPFVGGLLGGGRVPVDGAIPDVKNLVKAGTGLATNEMDSKKAKEMIGKELSKPLYYVLPPFGGGQMKKSVEGIQTVKNGGSYGVDDKGEKILKFPVENPSAKDYIKAGVFGKYALKEAKDYSDRGYKSLNANETKMYEEANLPYKELLEYLDKGLKKKEDKIKYINSKDMNSQQKWGIYKNDIFSKTKREDGTSELSDIEFIVSNGFKKSDFIDLYNKAQENEIDIPKIDDYKSMKEKGISLNNYIDYNVKVKNETKKKIDSGEIKDKQQLKGKDKIQILLDSNYSNSQKTAIYENYIRTKPKENEADLFKVLKQSNINIDEYLKYEQQDFKSDKEDNGTTSGKSVSGSKKKKVYSYVNNMKITKDQKLILLGSQYKLDNNERTELANLINKLPNQTKDEKMKLYGKMKGFTVYKNGKVSW